MKSKFIFSSLVGTLLLSLLSWTMELPFSLEWNLSYIYWMLLSNLLIVSVLGLLIKNSTLAGLKLSILVFAVSFMIGHFNILIEAYIFNVTNREQTTAILLHGLLFTLITSPLLVFIFGKWKSKSSELEFAPRSIFSWLWRVVVCDLLYVFFYLLAGFVLYSLYPQLMEFYGDKIPPFTIMVNTQFFRALIFIGIAILVFRSVHLSLLQRALLVGALFAILGGIAPLIMPGDDLMPGYIRFGHTFEVGISNSLYGFILTYLLGQKINGSHEFVERKSLISE